MLTLPSGDRGNHQTKWAKNHRAMAATSKMYGARRANGIVFCHADDCSNLLLAKYITKLYLSTLFLGRICSLPCWPLGRPLALSRAQYATDGTSKGALLLDVEESLQECNGIFDLPFISPVLEYKWKYRCIHSTEHPPCSPI